jgi:di/tricarboxylate transporter
MVSSHQSPSTDTGYRSKLLIPKIGRAELMGFILDSPITVDGMSGFLAFAPVGIPPLLVVSLLTYWFYPPEIKHSGEVSQWAADELTAMGKVNSREITVAVLVVCALGL